MLVGLHTVNVFKYFYQAIIIILLFCSHRIEWFEVLLFNIGHSIYSVFLSNINNLHTGVKF